MKQPISSHDLEQLSAYLDRQLNARERALLEARLQTEPELRETLHGLHLTRAALRRAPVHRAPRNFTLKAVPQPQPRFRLFPVFSLASALSALFFVITLAGQFLVQGAPAAAPAALTAQQQAGIVETNMVEMKAVETVALEKEAAVMMAAPTEMPLIIWGTTTPESAMATGMGGMDGAIEGTPTAQPPPETLPKSAAPLETPTAEAYSAVPEMTPIPEGEAQADSTRTLATETPTPEPTFTPEPTPSCTPEPTFTAVPTATAAAAAMEAATLIPPQAVTSENGTTVSNNGPILGAQPRGAEAYTADDRQAAATQMVQPRPPALDWLPLPLALLALVFAGLALFFQRKEHV